MTLRTRLLISVALVVATLAVAGFGLAQVQRRYLVDQVDQRLLAALAPALTMARDPAMVDRLQPPGLGAGAFSELFVAPLEPGASRAVARFAPGLEAGGSIDVAVPERAVAAGPNLVSAGPPGALVSPAFSTRAADGTSVRAVLARPPVGPAVLVGLSLEDAEAAYRRLLAGIGVVSAVVLSVTAVAGWWVVRLGLRPIRQMTEAADAIARGDLERRVAHPSARTEAGRLGRAFNVMLDERQGTEQRLRRFLSDASHELRTPLTSIRGYVELYRKGALRGDGELDDAMRRIAGEGARMGALVDDLLLLARLDEGRPLADEAVDLALIVRDAAGDAAALHPGRPLAASIEGPLPVRGDEARLRQVVGAVLSNALVHTPPDAAIHLTARRDGTEHVVQLRDEGEGMSEDVAAHAFERFFRGDPARTRHRGGSGLGLAIVRSIVEAHGGTVSLRSAVGVGTTIRIVLPASRSAGD